MKSSISVIVALFICPMLSSAGRGLEQSDNSWTTAADSLSAHGRNDSALVLATRALSVAEGYFGTKDTLVARILELMAKYQSQTESPTPTKWPSVIRYLKRALEIREKCQGASDKSIPPILYRLAIATWSMGELNVAEEYLKRDLAMLTAANGPESPPTEVPVRALAALLSTMGRFAEAEVLDTRLLSVHRKELAPDDPIVASDLLNLGDLLNSLGMYREAELNLEHARRILRDKGLVDDPRMPMVLNNLGQTYCAEGRLEKGEQAFQSALRLKRTIFGGSSTLLLSTLNNLGSLYTILGEYPRAITYYDSAIAIIRSELGGENYNLVSTLRKTAGVRSQLGEYAKAESLLVLARTIAVRSYGGVHPEVARCMLDLSKLSMVSLRSGQADSMGREAMEIIATVFGRKGPLYASALENMGNVRRSEGMVSEGLILLDSAFTIEQEALRRTLTIMSSRDALTSSRRLEHLVDGTLSAFADLDSPSALQAEQCASVILGAKGRLYDAVAGSERAVSGETSKALKEVNFQISRLFVKGPTTESLEEFSSFLDSLTTLADSLEGEMARSAGGIKIIAGDGRISPRRIASLLPVKSVLVEYLKYTYRRSTGDSSCYLAMVLPRNGRPHITRLGSASSIEAAIVRYQRHFRTLAASHRPITDRDYREYVTIARELYDLVWAPFERSIPRGTLVLISPDAALNVISFAGVLTPDLRYLIEKDPIHYVSAGRDIAVPRNTGPAGSGLIAFGDPDYNASMEARRSLAGVDSIADAPAARTNVIRNVRSGCASLSESTVDSLPGSRAEIRLAVHSWKKSHPAERSIAYEGAAASEERFKMESPQMSVIHIATHGYFLQGECDHARANDDLTIGENPLLLSGLYLAGANLHGLGAEEGAVEDGIVTALEVSSMDLHQTNLVVLSACESGLGVVEQGEGVYGLRRAFRVAGVKTVVSALWQISDQETVHFMKSLYSDESSTYPEQLQHAALGRLKDLRLRGKPTHPYSWGAFIATGDWSKR